jgi:hypothetical protein
MQLPTRAALASAVTSAIRTIAKGEKFNVGFRTTGTYEPDLVRDD